MHIVRLAAFAAFVSTVASTTFGQKIASEGPVRGLLVAGATVERIRLVREAVNEPITFKALEPKLAKLGFECIQRDDLSVLVIDSEIPLLKLRLEEVNVLKELHGMENPFAAFSISKLPGALRANATRQLSNMFGYSQADLSGSGVAFGLTLDVSIEPADGKPATGTTLFPDREGRRKAFDQLRSMPLPERRPPAPNSPQAGKSLEAHRAEVRFVIERIGGVSDEEGKATAELGRELDRRILDLRAKKETAMAALLKKFPLNAYGGDGLPTGFVDMNQLPADMKAEIEKQMKQSFAAFGFNSAEEAEAALARNPRVRVRTILTRWHCHEGGDRATGQPGSFGGLPVTTVNGIPGP